jgi:hypothetical protein
MKDIMRSQSVTVRLTPRQAVAAIRALEVAGAAGQDRAYSARSRVTNGLFDAGWEWDGYNECWTHDRHVVPDRWDE